MKLGMKFLMGSVFAAAMGASAAHAGAIPYPTPGVESTTANVFTATATGPITAYFAGSTASYTEEVGLLVNGAQLGGFVLNNQTSALGQAFTFGNVNAGNSLVFELKILNPSDVGPWYSTTSLNADGANHVYSTSATAGQAYAGSPAGEYVAFEDLDFRTGSNKNYFDDTFVFTNVSAVPGPVPGTGVVGLALLALYGAARLRRA